MLESYHLVLLSSNVLQAPFGIVQRNSSRFKPSCHHARHVHLYLIGAMLLQVNYFFEVFASPAVWLGLLTLLAVACAISIQGALAWQRSRHASRQADVSLLSPTLATELLGPCAARAWLLSVALDLIAKELPEDLTLLRSLGRHARVKLITLRDTRDPEAIPIASALAECCHMADRLLHQTHGDALSESARKSFQYAYKIITSS